MTVSGRRVRAIFGKELREYRHNGNIVYAMVIFPVVFLIQPVIQIFTLPSSASPTLHHEHSLVYMLAIPALVPAALASYSIVGERLQGTLEPILATPIRREELLLGKALAAFVPSLAVSYAVYALFIAIVELFAHPGVAPALIQGSTLLAQLLFTPLLAALSIWVGIAISARSSDPRTAGQLSILVSLPSVAVTTLIAFNVIPATLAVAHPFGAGLWASPSAGGSPRRSSTANDSSPAASSDPPSSSAVPTDIDQKEMRFVRYAPAATLQLAYLRLHQFLYRHSRGLIGSRIVAGRALLLTTTGRRSGKPRTCALIYLKDGDRLAVGGLQWRQ
jgi:ABC-2 type transport system permease protein